jgi:hypothetical protein
LKKILGRTRTKKLLLAGPWAAQATAPQAQSHKSFFAFGGAQPFFSKKEALAF